MSEREAFIIEAVRTPVGKVRGALSPVRTDDLAALVMAEVVKRWGGDPGRIDDVLFGCSNQAGEDNRNVARMALLIAGFPNAVPGATLNRLCGSGLEAVIQAARAIRAGEADLVLAGGVETMSRAPWSMAKPEMGLPSGPPAIYDTALGWRYPNPRLSARFPLESMGETAENIAQRNGIAREEQDRFAVESHRRAVAAHEAGEFASELVPVEVPRKKQPPLIVDRDEGPRADTSLEALSKLKPAFVKDGTVTAGNSSSLNDGASALLVASGDFVKRENLKPLARYVSSGHAGVDPRFMGLGPIPASKTALVRAGLRMRDMDLVELNEAFAAQSLACIRGLELDPAKTNVFGGAIAIGHPLGMSGARLATTLAHALARKKLRYGLATLCIGVGQGIAAVFERA